MRVCRAAQCCVWNCQDWTYQKSESRARRSRMEITWLKETRDKRATKGERSYHTSTQNLELSTWTWKSPVVAVDVSCRCVTAAWIHLIYQFREKNCCFTSSLRRIFGSWTHLHDRAHRPRIFSHRHLIFFSNSKTCNMSEIYANNVICQNSKCWHDVKQPKIALFCFFNRIKDSSFNGKKHHLTFSSTRFC